MLSNRSATKLYGASGKSTVPAALPQQAPCVFRTGCQHVGECADVCKHGAEMYTRLTSEPHPALPQHALEYKEERNGWHYRICVCGVEVGPFYVAEYADDAFDAHCGKTALPQQEEPADNFTEAARFAGITASQGMQFHMFLRHLLGQGPAPGFLPAAPIAPLLGQEEPARKNIHSEVLPEKYRFTPQDEARLGPKDFYSHHEGPRNPPTDVIEADRFMAWRWYGQFMSPMNEAALTGHAWRISRERQLTQALTSLAAANEKLQDVVFIYECSDCAWIGNPEHLGQKCRSCHTGMCIRVATSRKGEHSIVAFSNLAAKERQRAELAEASLAAAKIRYEKAEKTVAGYNTGGFADANAALEKYLDAVGMCNIAESKLSEAQQTIEELRGGK